MIVVLKRGDLDKDEVVAAVEKGAGLSIHLLVVIFLFVLSFCLFCYYFIFLAVGAEAVFVKGKTESAAVPAETASEATKSTETTPATVVTTTAGQKRSAVTDVGSRAEKVRKTLPGSLSKSLDKQNKTLLSFNDEDDDE
jgi:flagellar basal body-associated protein FliL